MCLLGRGTNLKLKIAANFRIRDANHQIRHEPMTLANLRCKPERLLDGTLAPISTYGWHLDLGNTIDVLGKPADLNNEQSQAKNWNSSIINLINTRSLLFC